jgi:SAM-dependent methyltransferase
MLNNVFGIVLYFLLPNHIVWRMLSEEEKQIVLQSCCIHNNVHYRRPEDYDAEHLRAENPERTKEGAILLESLKRWTPSSVLEIGPGNGFYTRLILKQPALKRYLGIDIVRPFVEYIKENVLGGHPDLKAAVVCGSLLEHPFEGTFDLILFVSSLHHIPDREAYFKKCAVLLNPGGRVVVIEPKHGVWRISQILRKLIKTHSKREYWMNRDNLGTHHFLTLSEARSLARASGLKMTTFFSFSFRGERYFPKGWRSRFGFAGLDYWPLVHLFATQVFIEFKKPFVDPAESQ